MQVTASTVTFLLSSLYYLISRDIYIHISRRFKERACHTIQIMLPPRNASD